MAKTGNSRAGSFAKPMLFLHPEGWAHLKKYYDGAAESLERYFLPTPEASLPLPDDIALADRVAEALDGTLYSSDSDCPYFACVLTNTDLEDDEAFYGGLGISQDEEIKIGGFTNQKLETSYGLHNGEENVPTICLLNNYDSENLEEIDEYLSEEDQEVYNAAGAIIEEIGTVVGGYLCADDNVSRIIFTVAKSPTGAWVGVLAVGIET